MLNVLQEESMYKKVILTLPEVPKMEPIDRVRRAICSLMVFGLQEIEYLAKVTREEAKSFIDYFETEGVIVKREATPSQPANYPVWAMNNDPEKRRMLYDAVHGFAMAELSRQIMTYMACHRVLRGLMACGPISSIQLAQVNHMPEDLVCQLLAKLQDKLGPWVETQTVVNGVPYATYTIHPDMMGRVGTYDAELVGLLDNESIALASLYPELREGFVFAAPLRLLEAEYLLYAVMPEALANPPLAQHVAAMARFEMAKLPGDMEKKSFMWSDSPQFSPFLERKIKVATDILAEQW